MLNFVFHNPAKIIFGKGTQNQIGEEIKKIGSAALMVYGSGAIKRIGLYDDVVASLNKEGVKFEELPGVQPNPRVDLVRKGIELCRTHNLDVILAIGGGSAIDTAKAIAVGVPYEGDVWDFYMGKAQAKSALPVCTILTIPAAGSESSNGSVITDMEKSLKRPYGSPLMIPKFSILNPEFTYSLPAYQTACGAADIFAHLVERYFTQVDHVDITDQLIEGTMRNIIHYAPLAIANPNNYDYRAEVMWTGTIAHNGLLNTGRLGDWGSHQIEHELSAIYDIAHGAGLAIVIPAWMRYVYKDNVDLFVQFATRVWGVNGSFGDKDTIVECAIQKMEQWFVQLGLPIRMSQADIPADRIDEMAKKCVVPGPQGHFRELHEADIAAILNLAK